MANSVSAPWGEPPLSGLQAQQQEVLGQGVVKHKRGCQRRGVQPAVQPHSPRRVRLNACDAACGSQH